MFFCFSVIPCPLFPHPVKIKKYYFGEEKTLFKLKKQIKWSVIFERFNDSGDPDNLSYFTYTILVCQRIYIFLNIIFLFVSNENNETYSSLYLWLVVAFGLNYSTSSGVVTSLSSYVHTLNTAYFLYFAVWQLNPVLVGIS